MIRHKMTDRDRGRDGGREVGREQGRVGEVGERGTDRERG